MRFINPIIRKCVDKTIGRFLFFFIFASSLMEVIEMLCFDKGTNQFFMASDEQVKIVENQMNDILKRMISEGKEIITLGEVMDALGIEKNRNQNDNQNHEQKGENGNGKAKQIC